MDSPYRGLVPFSDTIEDARFFHGREKETRLIVANLYSAPLTLLYGASGVGKTSILKAGVMVTLRSSKNQSNFPVYFNHWKGDVLINLQAAVVDAVSRASIVDSDGRDLGVTCLRMLERHRSSIDSLFKFLAIAAKLLGRHLVIILDQFEDYFLYHPEAEDDKFGPELSAALTKTKSRVCFLLSLRDDMLSQLDRFEGDIPFLFDNYHRIEHLDRDAARAAITEPLREYQLSPGSGHQSRKVTIEPELVEDVLDQLDELGVSEAKPAPSTAARTKTRIKAPYLQLVMTRLWEDEVVRGKRNVLADKTLQRLGGVKKIIAHHLHDVMRGLSWSQRTLATRLFPYLVSPSGGKRAETADQLAELSGASPKKTSAVLSRLEELRILTSFEVIEADSAKHLNYEIYHDSLAEPILDWRNAHRRKVRAISIVVLLSLPVIVLWWTWGAFDDSADARWLKSIVIIVLGVPLTIGFFIGRWWARSR